MYSKTNHIENDPNFGRLVFTVWPELASVNVSVVMLIKIMGLRQFERKVLQLCTERVIFQIAKSENELNAL